MPLQDDDSSESSSEGELEGSFFQSINMQEKQNAAQWKKKKGLGDDGFDTIWKSGYHQRILMSGIKLLRWRASQGSKARVKRQAG